MITMSLKVLTVTTTIKTWSVEMLKATVTWSATVLTTMWSTAEKATTHRSMVTSTVSTTSTYTTWLRNSHVPTSRGMITMWLVIHVQVSELSLSPLNTPPPKAELSKVTIPMAKLIVVPHTSLVVVLFGWRSSLWLWSSLRLRRWLWNSLRLWGCLVGALRR